MRHLRSVPASPIRVGFGEPRKPPSPFCLDRSGPLSARGRSSGRPDLISPNQNCLGLFLFGNETARPPVPHSTVHDLQHRPVAPCHKWVVLTRAAKLISGMHREASHTAFFKDCFVNHNVMLAELDILSAAHNCRMAHARQYARPQQHTHTMTRARRFSALSCQRRMHRTTWELLSGRACTLGTLGACTPARAMRQRCRTASVPPLHQHAQCRTWWVR